MDKEAYERAKKEVKRKKAFYKNLINWIVFSIFFIFLNLWTSPHFFWAGFPIAGWGIGVLFQGFDVFGFPGLSKTWERKKLEEELQKIDMESRLRNRYLELKEKQEHNLLDDEEKLDLEELRKIKRDWDESDLV